MNEKIYFDNAAATMISPEVASEILSVMTENYGNTNSIHSLGRESNEVLGKARETVASTICAKANEIYFTSGGTESNNLAIIGIAYANRLKGNHIITSKIEHHSTLDTFKKLEDEGFLVTYLDVDNNGLIDLAQFMRSVTPFTTLISFSAANSEIGTVQNIKAISVTAREKNIAVHVDAVQLYGQMILDVNELYIDAMTISAHKIYGPKGSGALYVREDLPFENIFSGGSQERGKRPGTVNLPGVAGFAKACENAYRDLNTNVYKIKKLSSYFIEQIELNVPDIHINGPKGQRVPHIVSVSFAGVEADSIATMLDLQGVCVSIGSACSSNVVKMSHVIQSLNLPPEVMQGTVRFSFGKQNTFDEIDNAIVIISNVVSKLRDFSPIYKKGMIKCITKK